MKVSASIELVWQLAAQEAIASEFGEIQPDHFLAGLLKFAELPVEDVNKIAPEAEVAKQLAEEVKTLREDLGTRSIAGTRVRRELRAKLGKGGHPHDGGRMHRSQACRELFAAAAKLAADKGSESLMVQHLFTEILASPTPIMAQVFAQAGRSGEPVKSKTPLLDRHGIDLTRQASAGKEPPTLKREPEVRAVLNVLGAKEKVSVFLICGDKKAACVIAVGVAQAIADKRVPSSLKGKRLIDLTAWTKDAEMSDVYDVVEAVRRDVEGMITEAAGTRDILYFGDWKGTPRKGETSPPEMEAAKAAMRRTPLQCIFNLSPDAYRCYVEKDPVWKRIGHPLWVRESELRGDIPDEL